MPKPTTSNELIALNARLFEAIGAAAFEADQYQLTTRSGMDCDLEQVEVSRLIVAIRKIGWLADMGANHNGGARQLEGAEDWLCPPALRDALSKLEIENDKRENSDAAKEMAHG